MMRIHSFLRVDTLVLCVLRLLFCVYLMLIAVKLSFDPSPVVTSPNCIEQAASPTSPLPHSPHQTSRSMFHRMHFQHRRWMGVTFKFRKIVQNIRPQ